MNTVSYSNLTLNNQSSKSQQVLKLLKYVILLPFAAPIQFSIIFGIWLNSISSIACT